VGVHQDLRRLSSDAHEHATLLNAVSYKSTHKTTARNIINSFESFEDLGVGGLDKQIGELYRRVFQSRSIPKAMMQKLGVKLTKGVLLYGPPGSGKTLVARTVAKLVGTDHVQLINTPMIMSKYLGESEKHIQSLFEPAEAEYAESTCRHALVHREG